MRNEIEAMTVIVNIQMMQETIHGETFAYDDFNTNTIEELRNLQASMIIEYNDFLKK